MNITLERDEKLNRGERYIVVDGVRWGRTIVSYHGVHGTSHAFRQEGGDLIGELSKGGYFHEVSVRSEKKRLFQEDKWRPTEEKVMEKIRDLIRDGRLRHPDIVRAEAAETNRQINEKRKEIDRKKQEQFEAMAREAVASIASVLSHESYLETVNRIVNAMRWAQTQ